MLIFLGEKLVGANFYAFCNYACQLHNIHKSMNCMINYIHSYANIFLQFYINFHKWYDYDERYDKNYDHNHYIDKCSIWRDLSSGQCVWIRINPSYHLTEDDAKARNNNDHDNYKHDNYHVTKDDAKARNFHSWISPSSWWWSWQRWLEILLTQSWRSWQVPKYQIIFCNNT